MFLFKIAKVCEKTCLCQRSILLVNILFGFGLFYMYPLYKLFLWLLVVLRLFWCAHGPVQYHPDSNWMVSCIVVSAGHYDRPVVINLASSRCLGIALHCDMTELLPALEVALLLVLDICALIHSVMQI